MPDHAHRVVAACAVCEGHMKPCNIFTREVAHCLGVALPGGYGDADEILTYLDMHWRRLSPEQAILAAGKGVFVVAGLRSSDFSSKQNSGHVCVVIPGKHRHYPRVFSTNAESGPYGKSRGDHPLNGFVFKHEDASRVQYFALPTGATGEW
jgi:hypothetical protein